MSPIIQVKGLVKDFKRLRAVDSLSFSVGQADIYGFLGQNGAGKSTTIRMLLTLIRPSEGEIEIFGMNLRTHRKEILRRVGAVIERPDLYKYLSAYENMAVFARMSGMRPERKRLTEQLEQVGLADRAHSKVETYSQGMKQRLGIGIALIHDPDLVILDEPTNGLDPQGIADIRHLILHLSHHLGKTVFVSSHLLSEMELIANRMLIIDKGRKVVEGMVRELFDPTETIVELDSANAGHTARVIAGSAWAGALREERRESGTRGDGRGNPEEGKPSGGQGDRFILKMDKAEIPRFTRDLVQAGVEVIAIRPRHSLEDYFLSLTTANQHVEAFTN